MRNVLLLAEFTGWPEQAILSMSLDRMNAYIMELNKIADERRES